MRKISILLVLVMIAQVLIGCGGSETTAEPSTRELLDSAMALYTLKAGTEPALYYSDAEEGSENFIDPGYLSNFFLGEFDADIPGFDLVEEFAMAANSSFIVFEIYCFKAKSAAAANEIKSLMQLRIDQKEKSRGEIMNYDAEQIAVLDGCEIVTRGKYVFLLATTDNSLATAKFDELLGGDKAEAETSGEGNGVAIINALSSVNNILTDGNKLSVGSSAVASDNPSALPELTVTSYSLNNHVILGGRCEQGAKIHVRGGVKDGVYNTDYNSWMCEVEIPAGQVTNLYITQEEVGKSESAAITVTVQARTDVDFSSHGVCQVAFGDNFQGHFYGQIADWTGTNILSDKQIEGVTGRIKQKVDHLANIDCELVYVIVPNPMAIYPETVPERYEKSTSETSRTEQFEQCAVDAGATVIDLSDILNEHRDDEFKIFNKTDSHWTDYGAYWGYYELMSYIGEEYPDAAPLEIEGNFEFYSKEVDAGDMMTHLELPNNLIQEYATFGDFLIKAVDNPEIYLKNRNELTFDPVNKTKTLINRITEGDLPTAMVVGDSFLTNIYAYLNNSFSQTHYQSMWNYKFDHDYIARTKPDYYIVLVAERNIGNILG